MAHQSEDEPMARPVRPRIRSLQEKNRNLSLEYVPIPESIGIDVEGIRNAEEVDRILPPTSQTHTLRNAETCLMYGGANRKVLIAKLAVMQA